MSSTSRALEAALGDVVERHESLRTIFPERDGVPRQQILDASAARPWLVIESVTEASLPEALASAARAGFDLSGEPPLRAHLFGLAADEHVLLLLLHHIAGDGWSLAPLARDLSRFYEARRQGAAADLPALPVQYADYTLWQHARAGGRDGRSERDRAPARLLDRDAQGPARADRPAERPPTAGGVELSGREPYPSSCLRSCTQACWGFRGRAARACSWCCRPALAALLTRLGAGSDIPIGSPIAGRTDSALDDLVGFFVNTLVLRTDTSGNPSFRELVARVRAGNLSAYSHQDLPFERLVEVLNPARSLSRHPLFQVMLALQNTAEVKLELDGLSCGFERVATSSAKFDLSVSLGEERGADGAPAGIGGVVEYATDLFDRASVEALVGRLVRLLEAAVADPERAIGSLEILAPEERAIILRGWNDTARAIPSATLPELFAEQAAQTPDAIAVVYEDERLTYARARCARQPAGASPARARRRSRGRGGAVRRALARDARRAHRHPQGGRRLSAARPRLSGRAAGLHAGRRRRAGAGHPIGCCSIGCPRMAPTSCGSMPMRPPSRAQPTTAPALVLDPHNPAYVIYTSGSTGSRKAWWSIMPVLPTSSWPWARQFNVDARASDLHC